MSTRTCIRGALRRCQPGKSHPAACGGAEGLRVAHQAPAQTRWGLDSSLACAAIDAPCLPKQKDKGLHGPDCLLGKSAHVNGSCCLQCFCSHALA